MSKSLSASVVFNAWATVISQKTGTVITVCVSDDKTRNIFFTPSVADMRHSEGDKEHGKITH